MTKITASILEFPENVVVVEGQKVTFTKTYADTPRI